MFDTLKFNAGLLKDSVLMRTTIFTSKEGPYPKDETMKQEIKDASAREEFLKNFKEGYYKTTGLNMAKDVVETINQGILFNQTPIGYMDTAADQDNLMLAVAAYLGESGAPLRKDYLTNKFIIQLNKACEYLGMPKYVNMTDAELAKDREIIFDAPDYSLVSPEIAEELKKQLEESEKREKERQERIAKIIEEADEYNKKLHEDALKELAEEEAKKAEKEAKKAEKKAQREAKKAEKKQQKADKKVEEQKASDTIEDAKVVELDKNIGIPSFKQGRSRAAVTKGVNNSAGTNNNNSASKDAGKGGSGKKKDDSSGDGDPDPASHKVDLNEFIPTEEVMKYFPIIDVNDEEKEKLLAQNELERIEFIRKHGGQQLRPVDFTSEATKKVETIASEIANGQVPTMEKVQDAINTVDQELARQKMAVKYESVRFFAQEINGRSDQQLIQDALNEACSTARGVTATVTPMLNAPDQYGIQIMQDGVIIDTFVAHGSRIFGRGVPVLEGAAIYKKDGKDALVPFFIPLRSAIATRSNIFRNVKIKNIDGEFIDTPKGITEEMAEDIKRVICKDYRLIDHLDLTNLAFQSDDEAARFMHFAAVALNKVAEMSGVGSPFNLPRYRVGNYQSFASFELFGDLLAFQNKPPFKADTTDGKMLPDNIGPDYRRIIVRGNKIQVYQPDGKIVEDYIKL